MNSTKNNDTGNSYEEINPYVEFVFYRVPKDNHELLLQVTKRLIELLKKEDVVYNCFGLDSVEKYPDLSTYPESFQSIRMKRKYG